MKAELLLLSVALVIVAESFNLFRTGLLWYETHSCMNKCKQIAKIVIPGYRHGKQFLESHPQLIERRLPHKVQYLKEVPVTLYRATNNRVKFEAIPPGTHSQHIQCICINPDERVHLNNIGTCGA